jgi:cystathionine gamma-lyase
MTDKHPDWSPERFGFETRAIHAGQAPDPTTGAVVTPVYLTSTYVHTSPGQHQRLRVHALPQSDPPRLRDLRGQPGERPLRLRLRVRLHRRRHGGALLSQGDHVACCDDMYGGTYRMFEQVFRRQGIDFSYHDLSDPAVLRAALRANTRMVWIESPTNPLMKLVDIAAWPGSAARPASGSWSTIPSSAPISSAPSSSEPTWCCTPPPST